MPTRCAHPGRRVNQLETVMKFPAGKYYIGDPCYVFEDDVWQKGCKQMFKDGRSVTDQEGGVFIEVIGDNGKIYCWWQADTDYGDGTYKDQYGYEYGVDAGCIGIVPFEMLDEPKGKFWSTYDGNVGRLVDCNEPFEVCKDGSIISVATRDIDVSGDGEEEEDEEDDWDEDDEDYRDSLAEYEEDGEEF